MPALRSPVSRLNHAPPARPSRLSPARIGVVAVVAIAALLAGISLLGAPSSPRGEVAAVVSPSTGNASQPPAGSAATRTTAPRSATPAPPTPAPTEPPPSPSASRGPGGPVDEAALGKRLQARLDAMRTKQGIPGVSVAILWDDGRQWLGVSGRSDVTGRVPMTTDTAFALASISKTFTAAVVLQLVEEGRLDLDEPVAPLLPAFALDRRITVRMLLDHTSGLPDFFGNRKIDRALQGDPDATWTAARTWKYVKAKRPVPGRTWDYSNTNYLLLGELAEAVTGRRLAAEVRDRLLDPLGLTTAWFQAVEKPRAGGTLGYRLLPKSGGGVRPVPVAEASGVMPFRSVVTAAGGAGSIAATALDAARWMQAFAGGRVLGPDMQAEMLADAARSRALHARIAYGLGIQEVSIAGHRALGHSGRYLGFRNVVRYLPDEGITIAVLTNQGVRDPAKIAASLIKIILPPPPVPSASPLGAPPSASPAP